MKSYKSFLNENYDKETIKQIKKSKNFSKKDKKDIITISEIWGLIDTCHEEVLAKTRNVKVPEHKRLIDEAEDDLNAIRISLNDFLADKEELLDEAKHVNEADISGSKISMLGTKIFNKIKIGSKFNTDTNVYTVKDFGRASNAFKEYIVTDKNGKDIGAKLSAMYSTTFALSDDPRSLVFRKEEMLNSITI